MRNWRGLVYRLFVIVNLNYCNNSNMFLHTSHNFIYKYTQAFGRDLFGKNLHVSMVYS